MIFGARAIVSRWAFPSAGRKKLTPKTWIGLIVTQLQPNPGFTFSAGRLFLTRSEGKQKEQRRCRPTNRPAHALKAEGQRAPPSSGKPSRWPLAPPISLTE